MVCVGDFGEGVVFLCEPKPTYSMTAWRLLFQSAEAEELAMISVNLASKFLFNVGFHTKKTLRLVHELAFFCPSGFMYRQNAVNAYM